MGILVLPHLIFGLWKGLWMRICCICKQEKEDSEFYPRRDRMKGKGLNSKCRSCCGLYRRTEHSKQWTRQWGKAHKDRRRNTCRKVEHKYMQKWVEYFKSKHGEIPKCQICGKELKWYFSKAKKSDVIHFDHKQENDKIKHAPINFIMGHVCSDKNKEIWNSCNFGILCASCNMKLPTINRMEWLKLALKYTEESN